jgi:hypothetical protein
MPETIFAARTLCCAIQKSAYAARFEMADQHEVLRRLEHVVGAARERRHGHDRRGELAVAKRGFVHDG